MKGIKFIQVKKPFTQINEDLALIGFANQINHYKRDNFLNKLSQTNRYSYFKIEFIVFRNNDVLISLIDRVFALRSQNQNSIERYFQFFRFPPPFSTFAGYNRNLTYKLEVPILLRKGDVIRSVAYYYNTYEEINNQSFVLICSNLKEDLERAKDVVIISNDIYDLDNRLLNNQFLDQVRINSINNRTNKLIIYFINYKETIQNQILTKVDYFNPNDFENNQMITRVSLNKVFGLNDYKFPFILRRSVDFVEIPVNYKTDYTHCEISFSKRGVLNYLSTFTLIYEIEKL